jgi:hypothetical protein
MDTSSVAYQRAISVLLKQTHTCGPSHFLKSCDIPTNTELLNAPMDISMLLYSSFLLYPDMLLRLSFLAPFGEGISKVNRSSVKRARDVISDAVMSELIDEDVKAQESFIDSVRHQIVVHCQRLRVHLTLIDRLMGIYNQSVVPVKVKGKAVV